jgi:predicted CoA-binding protein
MMCVSGRRDDETSLAERVLYSARRIAVLGMKPDDRREAAASYVPLYLSQVGYEIIPVPVRYPEVTTMLGRPVVRNPREIAPPPDILSVFLRPENFARHLPDVLALRPPVVWFQSGLLESASAAALESNGIVVLHECIACRRAAMSPSTGPFHRRDGSAS